MTMDSAQDPTPPIDESNASAVPSNDDAARATLEDEVKQLVGSVSSWWSGFSKKSQEQINEVKAQIDSQGGLVSIAKREAARFEAQLSEAQKAARNNVQADDTKKRASIDIDGWGTAGTVGDSTAGQSGKGKEKQQEGDEGAAVERLEERMRQGQQRSSSEGKRSDIPASASGEALFDADNDDGPGSEFKVIEDAISATRQNAQTAMHSMQSFWDRIQSDPRVSNMQASVAKTLQNISVPKQATEGEQDDGEKGGQSPQTKRNLALPDLSKQFQAAFPNLELKQSQAMAKRYFEMSQSAARDWGKEMGTLMSDLVKVVPPEEEQGPSQKETAKGAAAATGTPAAPLQTSTDDDDFDWDREVETGSSAGLETTTGPPTTSWEDADPNLVADVQTVSEADEQSSKRQGKQTASSKANKKDEEEDSDWE